ncbi:unnamed protein product [Rhizoctonia solani]|uniref:AB hydrolase-1 domain-containing protein n=1 Tax=Rhizoctonia solani TaxID=456999 RepID=A0A8H2X028_9AGAM|nr:unnamed protein product [Rhizoctonia solani]
MLIGTSEVERFVVLTTIWAIRAITPISFLHILLSVFWSTYRLRSFYSLTAYALLESGFYLFVYLPRKAHLQKPAVHPAPLSPTKRHELFTRCLSHLTDAESFKRWFLDSSAEIRRENVIEWLKWGFFAGEACLGEKCDKHDKELVEYLEALERALGETFLPGYNPELKSIRTTMDDVVIYHRPVVWYLIVCALDMICAAIFHSFGFVHFASPVPTFPPRLHTFFSSPSPAAQLSYWYKPGRNTKSNTPFLFLHGIGIGLLPYLPLIISYSKTHPDSPIIVPELLSISGRIARPPLSPHEFQSALEAIFQKHNVTEYNLAAHSYGTGLASILIRPPSPTSLPKPNSATLLDPIPILLHLPSVARNFLYRKPQRANEHEIYYFACTDMGVAHALARHFFWTESVLWKEDLDALDKRVAIVLSGEDIIVDSPSVWTYLTNQPPPSIKSIKPRPFVLPAPHPDSFTPTVCEGGNVEAYYLGGLDHAQMFLTRESWRGLIKVIDRVSSRD